MSVPTRADGALVDIAASLAPVGIDDLLGEGELLVIAPHPDDETLGCGAALAAALARGTLVTVALLTDGEGSHPRSRRWPPETLKALRRQEFLAALDTLAAAAGAPRPAVLAFGLPDTAVGTDAARAVEALIARQRVGTVWCTWRGDPHVDHAAAARIADSLEATLADEGHPVARFNYAVWGRFGVAGAAVDPATVRPFSLAPYASAKQAAMAQYRSQLTGLVDDDPNGFVMPPALTDAFATQREIFMVAG